MTGAFKAAFVAAGYGRPAAAAPLLRHQARTPRGDLPGRGPDLILAQAWEFAPDWPQSAYARRSAAGPFLGEKQKVQ